MLKRSTCVASAVIALLCKIPPAIAADSAAGAQLFHRNCASCHMSGAFNFAPPLNKYFVQGREDSVRTLVMEGGSLMPGFKYMLNKDQVQLIIAYIGRLEPQGAVASSQGIEP
jgi:cytochrome c6